MFIPEKQDSVLVSFLDGQHLSHPVVIGSMYHGDNAENQGGGKGNHIKSIVTRSNHRIEFNDREADGWGITISDRNGNTMHFDTKGKNITVTAPESITLGAKNIFLNGKEIELNGDNIKLNASQNILEQAPTIGLDANGNSGSLTLKATKNAELNGGKETNLAGNEIISSSTANTTINGMIVKINS